MRMERADDEWDDIVRRLGDDVFAGVPDIVATPPVPPKPPAAAPGDAFAGLDDDDFLLPDERFIPPSPRLPQFSRRIRLGWASGLSGLALLICASTLGFADTWSTLIGGALVATGITVLVLALPRHRDDEGDGAVV